MSKTIEDIFSEGYLEAFYKAHVASRRSSVDDDIAAIEAEIKKVQKYQSKFRSYRVKDQNLNSCGNSECSDDDESYDTGSMESMPTSIFKVYNSSRSNPFHNRFHQSGVDVFTWSQHQLVTHDHWYVPSKYLEGSVPLDQEGVRVDNIIWNQLTLSKKTQALKRLSAILRNRPPSLNYSPNHSSLSFLPRSLADFLKTNKGVVQGPKSKSRSLVESTNITTGKDIASLIFSRDQSECTVSTTPSRLKRKTRPSPYERIPAKPIEITRIRNSSTCSESEESLEVD